MSLIQLISNFISTTGYGIIITIVAIILVLIIIFYRIKCQCLELASKMVAEVETHDELSGKEKFAVVVEWLNQQFPGIFKMILIQTVIKNAINLAYDSSKEYTDNYIKRKTGYDISEIINKIKDDQKVKN